jgi:hypothetical protein
MRVRRRQASHLRRSIYVASAFLLRVHTPSHALEHHRTRCRQTFRATKCYGSPYFVSSPGNDKERTAVDQDPARQETCYLRQSGAGLRDFTAPALTGGGRGFQVVVCPSYDLRALALANS